MDEKFIARFPEIAEQIFEQLNNEDLIKSKEVDKAWCDLIDQRLLYKRMVQSYTREVKHHKNEFNLVLKKMPAENLKKFALACQDMANASMFVSRSAHRTTNFPNSEFQFPQSKVLQSVFIFLM